MYHDTYRSVFGSILQAEAYAIISEPPVPSPQGSAELAATYIIKSVLGTPAPLGKTSEQVSTLDVVHP